MVAGLGLLAVVLNWITTGHHPIAAMGQAIWSVVVMDGLILAASITAIWAATRVDRAAPRGAGE